MRDTKEVFPSIDEDDMRRVTGAASTVAASSSTDANSQLMTMLTQITQSIQALAQNKNGGLDQTTLMIMMMMMMGGGGGGGFGGPPFGPTFVRVNADYPYGGWGGGGCGCCGIC